MLNFKCIFDAEDDINKFIEEGKSRTGQGPGIGCSPSSSGDLRIVGQEQDGTLIYTWSATIQLNQEETEITHVGSWDPITKTNMLVFTHDKRVEIVNATLSQEHAFLGYVTVEQVFSSDSYGKRQKQDVYRAFLAEIQPQNRVFYLNLERHNYLKLQFMYGQYKGQHSNRESHLIVFLHKESIGLYHLPIARVGDKGVIMGGEPKKEQIFHKKYVWCQWSLSHQRMYVVHFRKQGKNTVGQTIYKPYMTAYQFNSATACEFMLEVLLDLPIPHIKSSVRSVYLLNGPYNCIPDSAINMKVLTLPNGTFCICYQHPLPAPGGASKHSKVTMSEDSLVSVQYTVCMLHHGKQLNCIGPKMNRKKVEKTRITFSWMNDYLLAYIPGCFSHLLNVGIEFEPCHHILWHDGEIYSSGDEEKKTLPPEGTTGQSAEKETTQPHFVTYIRDKSLINAGTGYGLFDCTSMKGYKVSPNRDVIEDMFADSVSTSTKLSLMHYAMIHVKDLAMTRRLCEMMVADSMQCEIPALMDEFLVGTTYTGLKKQIDRSLMKYFAYTTVDVFRGLVEKAPDGSRVCSVSYSSTGSTALGERRIKWHGAEDVWENLSRQVKGEQVARRFSTCEVRKELDTIATVTEQQQPESQDSPPVTPTQPKGFFKRLSTRAKSAFSSSPQPGHLKQVISEHTPRPPSRSEQILGTPPPFLSGPFDKAGPEQDLITNTTIDVLSSHLGKQLFRESKTKVHKIATEFTSCQRHQSYQLCHILWSVLQPEPSTPLPSLSSLASSTEYEMFLLLERFFLSLHQMAYPAPAGFQLYFTCLAFRALQFRVFLQYIDRGILRVTIDFVHLVISDLEDSQSNVDVKCHLVSLLPLLEGVEALKGWDHPVSRRILAQNYTAACVADDFSNWPLGSDKEKNTKKDFPDQPVYGRTPSASGITFPPLTTLLKQLQYKDTALVTGERGVDFFFLEQASLLELGAQS